jgi:outer membrane protein TolC
VKQDEAELMLFRANNGLSLARMALCQMIGYPLDAPVEPADSLVALSACGAPIPSGTAPDNRPEIRLLMHSSGLAQTGVDLMKSRFLPDIGFTANFTVGNPDLFNGFEKQYGTGWNLAVVCRIPIFHFGDRFHTLHAAQRQKEAADLKLEEAREMISLEIRQARFNCDESYKKITVTQSMVRQADENLRVTRDRFREGILKSTDVLEAQGLWQKARTDEIEARAEQRTALVKLQKATGNLVVPPSNDQNKTK